MFFVEGSRSGINTDFFCRFQPGGPGKNGKGNLEESYEKDSFSADGSGSVCFHGSLLKQRQQLFCC